MGKKCDVIKPEGILNSISYLGDSAGCGYIRIISPCNYFSSWKHKNLSFNFLHVPIFINDKSFYNNLSFVKFQRSATEAHLNIMKHFKRNIQEQTNTGLIYESDDNLLDIPKSNFAHEYYVKHKSYIEEMLSLVDGITVSTGYLKGVYKKYNKNISVVKNRLCGYLWGKVNKRDSFENVGDKVKIVYPGSQNHFSSDPSIKGGDISPKIMDFIKKTTDKYEWIFIGGLPEELKMEAKDGKITYLPWVNILEYPRFLKNIQADIAIAPLEDNEFNKSKSNLKMLEYTVCGLPAVYTNIEPYKNAKYKADTDDYFIHLIEMLASNPDMRKKGWASDYNLLKNDLFLEDNRIQWINENLKLFNKRI